MSPFKINTLTLFLLAISHTTARQSAILDPAYPSDITCVSVGTDAVATWVNALSQTCTWTGKVGANLGINPVNRGDYGCMGRCGGGCGGVSQRNLKEGDPVDASRSIVVANVYTQNCFSHDVCSYFNNARGGAADPNCGKAFIKAVDDTLFGSLKGCSADNPKLPVTVPTVLPICVSS